MKYYKRYLRCYERGLVGMCDPDTGVLKDEFVEEDGIPVPDLSITAPLTKTHLYMIQARLEADGAGVGLAMFIPLIAWINLLEADGVLQRHTLKSFSMLAGLTGNMPWETMDVDPMNSIGARFAELTVHPFYYFGSHRLLQAPTTIANPANGCWETEHAYIVNASLIDDGSKLGFVDMLDCCTVLEFAVYSKRISEETLIEGATDA